MPSWAASSWARSGAAGFRSTQAFGVDARKLRLYKIVDCKRTIADERNTLKIRVSTRAVSASEQVADRNGKRGARDVSGFIGEEEQGRAGDFLCCSQPPGGNQARALGIGASRLARADDPREDHVHGDPVPRLLVRDALGQGEERHLRGPVRVGARCGAGGFTSGHAEEKDPAVTAPTHARKRLVDGVDRARDVGPGKRLPAPAGA